MDEYWLGHLFHIGVNTTAGACRLSWEGHPKVPREGTFHFKKNLLVGGGRRGYGEGINGDEKIT